MYTRILVPVDGSSISDRGLEEAVKLAKLTGARLRLIHVINQLVYASGIDGMAAITADRIPLLREGGEDLLKTRKTSVEERGVPVDTALFDSLAGRLCDLVAAEALEWHADLIVLGTHGRRGVARVFMGSDAEQIVRLAPTPVLLVRASEEAPVAVSRDNAHCSITHLGDLRMKTGDSVKVMDQTVESFGRVGTVRSAGFHDGPADRHGNCVKVIDVLLDGDTVPIEFHADQVALI